MIRINSGYLFAAAIVLSFFSFASAQEGKKPFVMVKKVEGPRPLPYNGITISIWSDGRIVYQNPNTKIEAVLAVLPPPSVKLILDRVDLIPAGELVCAHFETYYVKFGPDLATRRLSASLDPSDNEVCNPNLSTNTKAIIDLLNIAGSLADNLHGTISTF